jgi:hypothetical protein
MMLIVRLLRRKRMLKIIKRKKSGIKSKKRYKKKRKIKERMLKQMIKLRNIEKKMAEVGGKDHLDHDHHALQCTGKTPVKLVETNKSN